MSLTFSFFHGNNYYKLSPSVRVVNLQQLNNLKHIFEKSGFTKMLKYIFRFCIQLCLALSTAFPLFVANPDIGHEKTCSTILAFNGAY